MQLVVGQKVAYPSQGVCVVESLKNCQFGDKVISGFSLRVLNDNSTIFVPADKAASVGIRPVISPRQCRSLIDNLSQDFDTVSCDWKVRSKEYAEKLQSGDVFQAADVLKKLTFLSHEKKLSFREQTLLEKARFLIISEVTNADANIADAFESEILALVETACLKHELQQPKVMLAGVH